MKPTMKKNAFTVSEFVFGFAAVGLLTLALFPEVYQQKGLVKPPANCASNLKEVSLAVRQYVQDYDEQYPLVNSGKDDWKDILMPYSRSEQVFQCPKEIKGAVEGTTDYFYNARLSRQSEYKLEFISNVVLLGDGASNSLSNFSITQLPKGWTLNNNSPSLRHLNSEDGSYAEDEAHKHGANYAFADGHVKWLTPERVTTVKPSKSVYTFAPS